MTEKTTADLNTENDDNITANGANSNTGANLNTLLENIIDSMVNKLSDKTDMITESIRVGSEVLTATSNIVISFSSVLPSANYQVFLLDIAGDVTAVHDKVAASFQVDSGGTGTISWIAILDL